MRVGIVGHCGVVGSAYARIYTNRGANVIGIDPADHNSASYSDLDGVRLVYVCVPSPTTGTGWCDTSVLEQTVMQVAALNQKVPIVCKTTAPPSVYAQLQAQAPEVVHAPEFLRQAYAQHDIERAELLVYGGEARVTQVVARLEAEFIYDSFRARVEMTDIRTAALYKYLRNSFLAAKVTFMNDFYNLATAAQVDWKNVQHILERDEHIGPTHNAVPSKDGFGWAGACFPKDLTALVSYANVHAVDLPVLETVLKRNQQHRLKNKDTK